MSHAAVHTDHHVPPRTASAWANVVLAVATLVLVVYVACVVAASWLVASALSVVSPLEPGDLEVVDVAADVAPGLLVGWCTGRAVAAVLERGESLPPAVGGLVAGALGVTAGAAVLVFTGIL